jgi:hypothetical protein
LVVLIVEGILGIAVGFSSNSDRTYLILGMLILIFLLVLIVAVMATFRPRSLYGKTTNPKKTTFELETSNTLENVEIVNKPKILCGGGFSVMFGEMINRDANEIKQAYPKAEFEIENDLTAEKFRKLLTRKKFDIVQLTVNVKDNGDIYFDNTNDFIPAEGMLQLLEVGGTKLLVLACCDSVPLAAKLALKINMIASTGTLGDIEFKKWIGTFYHLLSCGYILSRAYSISVSTIQLPLVIILKKDYYFSKTKST